MNVAANRNGNNNKKHNKYKSIKTSGLVNYAMRKYVPAGSADLWNGVNFRE